MKEFLQSILKNTEDRIKNPFIGAFLTSWILFNWRPILFLIFSDKKIEQRIIYITKNFNDTVFYFWAPLLAAVFYIGILPYINYGFEYIVKYSHKWRNRVSLEQKKDTLELQVGIARNEILLEEEKTTFRERNNHNNMVESLQNQVKILTDSLDESHKSYIEATTVLIEQKEQINKDMQDIVSSTTITIDNLKRDLLKEQERRSSLYNENNFNEIELKKAQQSLQILAIELEEEKFINKRIIDPTNKIIYSKDIIILEYFNSNKDIYYYDLTNNMYLSTSAVLQILKQGKYNEVIEEENLKAAIKRMTDNSDRQQKINLL